MKKTKRNDVVTLCSIKVVRERWVEDGTWYVVVAQSKTARGQFQELAAYRSKRAAHLVAATLRDCL